MHLRNERQKNSAAISPDQRTLREERIIAARSSDCTFDVLKINLLLPENFPSIDFKSVGRLEGEAHSEAILQLNAPADSYTTELCLPQMLGGGKVVRGKRNSNNFSLLQRLDFSLKRTEYGFNNVKHLKHTRHTFSL